MRHQITESLSVEFGPTDFDETFVLIQEDQVVEQARRAILECGLEPEVKTLGNGRSELRVLVNKLTMPFDRWTCALRVLSPDSPASHANVRAYRPL